SRAAGIFGPSSAPTPWSEIGDGGGLDFVPVLSLNGSSVTDGCRVLVTNVEHLPATEGVDCQGVPAAGNDVVGPVSGSIDPFVGLRGRGGDVCDRTTADVPITTGALLSARFPLVSPSGALVRCIGGEETTTYVVDGGYYENSGLLSLLQIWEGVEDDVRAYNATARLPIEPWFLLVDNHYRAAAKKVPPGRPLEILAPLEAKGQDVLSQTMLEQAAIWEMRDGETARFARIAPAVHPGVEAPLGWVLSSASRADLDDQLERQIAQPDAALAALLELLGVTP
ncbi:MAG: hypothetical protein M3271_06255, partial [Actinomycetota bacterium]|nr:hypothetical protein [Actinomycetota bacterium]